MSSFKSFLKTLKQIGYNDAESLEETDVQSLVLDKKLGTFLQVFCSLNKNNVLTTEEIQEYSSLTPNELCELEAIQQNTEKLDRSNTDEYKKIDLCCMQEQINLIENHNKSMERQIELMKKHEANLLQERGKIEIELLNAKKKFQMYELNVVPQAESEYVSSLQSILKHIGDLNTLITPESKAPASLSFEDAVREYLTTEEKIQQCVKMFLDNNFQIEEKNNSLFFITRENSENENMLKEAIFLQKSLKKQLMNKITSELEVQKIEALIQYYSADHDSHDFKCHPSQLSEKLEDAIQENAKLRKKHEELNMYVLDAISKFIDAQFSEITESIEKKTRYYLQYAIKEMALSRDTLLLQRSRLEILISALADYKKTDLENIKLLIDNSLSKLKQDLSVLQHRIDHSMKDLKETGLQRYGLNPETSLYLSLYRILAMPHEMLVYDLPSVTLQDVLQRANKLLQAKEDFEKKHKEKLKSIELMEKQTSSIEALLSCSDPNFTDWHDAEQTQNADLNKLRIKLSSLEMSLAECSKELKYKQNLLQAKRNLSLARDLYVYALTDQEYFKECINSIKEAVKNSADY